MLDVTVVGVLDMPPAWMHLGAKCCWRANSRLTGGKSFNFAFSISTLDDMLSKNL